MPDSRTLIRAGGRGLVILVAAAVGVTVLGAAAIVPWPEHRAEPLSRSIQPAESRTVRVCPGPMLKRIRPRAQGRAYRILKRTSHVTLVVKEKE